MATKTFSERCKNECTTNVIFLFQYRRYVVIGIPDGYWHDGDCICKRDDFDPDIDEDHGEMLSGSDLVNIVGGEYDVPCAIATWETERVFLSREEATEYGRAKDYNYRDGWQVYGVQAHGELVDLLANT